MSKPEVNLESRTDWERVKREAAEDAPIAYDPNDPDDGPYDPNDDEATRAYLDSCDTIFQGKVIRRGTPHLIAVGLVPEVVARFKSQGDDWEERINETLKKAVGL